METDDVIKRIIMLAILLFVLPGGGSDLLRLVNFIAYVILLVAIILLAATQVDVLKVFIPENLLEKALWVVVFVASICILVIRISNSLA